MIIGLIVCFEMETQLVTPIIRLYRGSFAQRHTPCLMSIAIVLVSDLQKPALKYKKGVYVGKVLLLKCYAGIVFLLRFSFFHNPKIFRSVCHSV